MTTKATYKGLHIRNAIHDTHKGIWQAFDGDQYLAGANGPMALFVMGAFLDAVYEERYAKKNPGLDWLPEKS